MKYSVDWCETIKHNGKEWIKATVTDEANKKDEVSIWPDFRSYKEIMPGITLEGVIRIKGKYKNLVDNINPPNFVKQVKGSGIQAAQERKAEMIKDAQERKNESVAYFNSLNSAIALLAHRPQENADKTKEFIIYWRDWFLSEWRKYESLDFRDKHNPF